MGAEKNFVAIIGMSGLFPEAEDLDKFYDNLCKGHDAVREISETRLKYSTLYPFYNYQEIAHLDRVDQFDHAFFNLSKKEAECMDPGQRKLLELAAKAIMDAGYSLKTFKGSNTSVYLGGGVDSKYAKNIQEFDPSILTGNLNAMGAGRISYHLDLRGAAMMIGTACSSALAAVHHACHDIIGDEAEYALAGGFHVLYNFARKDEVNKLGTEALDGRAKAFDEKADGTGGGEGGGFVLLKRLDRAIRDNDNIHAVIRATACNQDGRTSNGLTAPSPTAQTAVITKAWKKAGIDPRSIEYIEAHGTGTKLGDPIEIQGITNAFGAFGINGDHRCAISSVKSNIGHLDNAAGIAGLIKCVLALKNGVHFPSVHFNKPNPFIDFEKSSTYVNSTFQPWVSKSGKRTAGVSSFGISGTNVHVVLEEAPSTRLAQARTEKHLLKISGKTLEAFRSNLAAVIDYLDKTDTELDHALYTLNAGRDDFKFREALLARSKSELISELRSLQKKDNASVQSFSEEDVQVIYLLSGEIIPGTVTNELKASSARFKEIFEDYASRLSKAPGAAASTVLTQLAIYKVMQEAGIAHHSIIATGIGKATRELIANEDNLLPVILRVENGDDDYKVPLDSDKLQAALAKIISTGKCVFVEIGEKHATLSNSLSKGQNEIPKPDVMVLMDGADLESAFVGLYNRGVIPDWKTHYQGRNMKKVSAPDYIFDPIRCWYKEPVEQPEKIFNSWFYDLEWMKREPLSRTTSVVKNWLMIMDNRGVGEALHQELLKQGHMVVPVYANGTFRKDKNGSYHISPASEADHIRLVDHLKLDGNLPDGIIHLGNCTAIDAMDDRLHERTLDEGLRSQFLFAKILDQKLSGSDFEFLMISSEACQVSDDDHTFFPLRAGALGFLRGLCSEYPLVKAKVIDVDASVTDTATVVQNILSEMNVETDCKVVAYRKHKRYVQALAPVKQHSIEQVAGPIMVKNKTYLITGGLNGLGYEIARALSEHVGCSLILTGRTKLPDAKTWDAIKTTDNNYSNIQKLRSLEQHSFVRYIPCDLTDREAVKNLKAEIDTPISGIIHAAALPGSKKIKNSSLDEFNNIINSRVKSALNLIDVFDGKSLDIVVLFSSLSGMLPAQDREADYAAGCTIINEYGRWLKQKQVNARVINWCGWQDAGMLYRLMPDREALKRANKPLLVRSKLGTRIFEHFLSTQATNAMVLANPQLMHPREIENIRKQKYFSMEALLGSTTLQAEPPIILKKELPPKPVVKFFVSSDTPATPTEQLLGKIWADVLKLSVLEKTDDFFAIGGNSINGFQVVKKVESAFGVSMEVEDLFEFLTFEELAAHIDTLLAAQRIEEEETTPLAMGGLPVYEDQQYYKVSHAQKRLWILDQLEGTSASYNMPALFEINETLDVSVLKLVFQTLIARHESLRTSFTMTSGGPMQKITEAAFIQFDIVQHDFRDVADQDRAIRSYLLEVSHASFDLKKAPLLRVDLLQLENEKYLLFINTHHIVSDGWSINVFFKEMSVLYFSLLAHQPSPLKPLRYQYKDYTIYQNSLLSTDGLKAHQEYWLKKFSGEIPVLNFPADRVSKQHAHKRGNRLEIKLERELYEQIQGIAREEHCTTFMVILSALKVLLYKYTGQTDIVVGTPLAERSHPELANQIGFYLDNLALRTQLDSSDTFDEVLRKVKATTIEAFTHKMYPFDRLVDDLGLSRDANKFPLFNIGLTWNTAQENHSTVIEKKVSIQGRELEERMVKTDIWFYGIESPNGISFSVEYDAELFRDQKIFNLLQHFKHLASQLSLQDRRPIRAWSILTQEERTVLVDEFNNGKTAIHGELNITSQFHRQVASTPGAEALVYKDKRMTYADLNRSANALAHYIIEHHAIKPGDFVGIYGYRSERLIIAILAILKAGATYVPMDVNSPKERIGKMLADANVSLLMTDSDLFFDITPHFAGSIVALDLELEKLEGRETNITIGSSNNYPAYVIFTSGSTGVPKGVLVGQEGVVNMIYEPNTRLAVTQEDVMALFFPISFDASVFQIFMALFSGATLVMLDDKILQDVKALPGYMKSEGVTIVTFSPSYLSLMQPEELSFLRAVLTGGEVAPFEQTLAFLPHMDYYNAYGPTEFSVCASMKKVGEEDRARGVIPIGGPIQNTEIYVLDQNHELVPVGVPGEICLAGKGLAHGYINRPELTHEKFVDNPFRKGEKMYKTGDLGQWHHDGVLEYCGRVDRQVKIRGYRIELSEIEAAIRSRVTVENCVVTPLQEANGEVVLAAYISGNGTYLPEDYKALLSQTLPAYMIPAYFVNVHQIPVTSNGKANLRALPDPTKVRVNQRDVQTPTNAVEENLLNLWLRILGDKEIGIHDNFFEIGGNSLKAIELVAAINNHWKNDLHLRDLFLKPTIAEQALLVTRPPEVERIPIKRIEEQEHYPVAHAQKGVYLLTHYERKAVPYNMTKYFKLNRIDVNILEKAVREFYRRHDSLRSTFHYINNEVRQIIAPLDDFKGKLMHEDFTQEEDAFMKVTKRMDEHVNVIFNKNEGPLCKLFLFHLPKHRYVLLILIDHIISDAWSVNQISDELTTLYRAFAQGEPSPLPEPKIQCYDYATWQVNYLKSAAFQELKSFWDAKLGGKNGIVDFTVYSDKVKSIDRVTSYRESMTKELAVHFKPMTPEETNDVMGFISAVIPYEGLAYRFVLNNEMKTRLIQFAQELQVSVYTVVFTSINILIYSAAKRTDVLSAVPVSTREQDEVKDQIGWFINKVLVASEMDGEATVETCVREAYHNILEAMDHATYPFSKLLNDYDRSLDTVCPVMVHYVGYDMNQAEEITDFSSEHLSFSLPSFDLNFTFYEKANGIETVLEYRSDIFTPEVIDQLMADYLEILDNMLDKNRKLDDLLTSKKMKLDEQIIETK